MITHTRDYMFTHFNWHVICACYCFRMTVIISYLYVHAGKYCDWYRICAMMDCPNYTHNDFVDILPATKLSKNAYMSKFSLPEKNACYIFDMPTD